MAGCDCMHQGYHIYVYLHGLQLLNPLHNNHQPSGCYCRHVYQQPIVWVRLLCTPQIRSQVFITKQKWRPGVEENKTQGNPIAAKNECTLSNPTAVTQGWGTLLHFEFLYLSKQWWRCCCASSQSEIHTWLIEIHMKILPVQSTG